MSDRPQVISKLSLLSLLVYGSFLFGQLFSQCLTETYAAEQVAEAKQMKQNRPLQLIKQQKLLAIPSISSLTWTPEGLYALADNMPVLYCLEPECLSQGQMISLAPDGSTDVLPKSLKPDYEASVLIETKHEKNQAQNQAQNIRRELWVLGSGSLASRREQLVRYDLYQKTVIYQSLSALYAQIAQAGKSLLGLDDFEVNIEGAASVKTELLLANRGHIAQPVNYLIQIQTESMQLNGLQKIELPQAPFVGVSALEYVSADDRLWLTASTEGTSSVYEDGEIGDSYLGWIDHYSQKRQQAVLKPDGLLNLTELNPAFKGQKIEGLAIQGNQFWLGADNDGGEAYLFLLQSISHHDL